MEYWVAFKNSMYVSDFDEFSSVVHHTKNKEEALRFKNFADAVHFFNFGYAIIKEYN